MVFSYRHFVLLLGIAAKGITAGSSSTQGSSLNTSPTDGSDTTIALPTSPPGTSGTTSTAPGPLTISMVTSTTTPTTPSNTTEPSPGNTTSSVSPNSNSTAGPNEGSSTLAPSTTPTMFNTTENTTGPMSPSPPANSNSTTSSVTSSTIPGNTTLDPTGNNSTSGPTTILAATDMTQNNTDITGPSTSPPEYSNATTNPLPTATSPGNTTLDPAGNTSTSLPTTIPATTNTTENITDITGPSTSPPENITSNTSPFPTIPNQGNTTLGPAGNTSTPGPSTPQTTPERNNGTTAGLPTTTRPPGIVCPAVSCPPDSVCLQGICQCFAGRFMVNGTCETAQVFPGELHIVSLEFVDDMANSTSEIFRKTSAKISSELRGFLADTPGYVRSEVLSLARGSVLATVNNVFQNSNATQKSVNTAIVDGIKNSGGFLNGTIFTATELCLEQPLPCDSMSTKCQSLNGRAQCSCQEGFIPNVFSSKSCSACPSGTRADSVKRTCPPCSFGYAGINCNDSSLLAVVVISVVLGSVLLLLVLGLIIWMCCFWSSPKQSSSPYPAKEQIPGSWGIPGVIPIPRATTQWDSNPSIEMSEGNGIHNLTEQPNSSTGGKRAHRGWRKTGSYDLDPAMRTFKGKNPSRYSYLVQGHENPYFLSGEDKKTQM
uniref:SEA domain-containing protein n=1 Tax=Gadus morhua TaxID=8049 RepID=A0A8C5A8J5_GADMO